MKACPTCGIEFEGYYSRIYCSKHCQDNAYYQRSKYDKTLPLRAELAKYGIKNNKLPSKANAEFLSDLILALKLVKAPKV